MESKQNHDTIYRYFSWNDAESKKILTQKEIYFCNALKWKNFGEYDFKFRTIDPKKLHDDIEKTAYHMRNHEPKVFERWFNIHIIIYKIDVGTPPNLGSVDRDLWENQIIDRIVWFRIEQIMNNQDSYVDQTKKFYYRHTGIFSTSLVKDSKQLWRWKDAYKDSVCIGLNLSEIKKQLDKIGNYTMGPVIYNENLNEIDFAVFGESLIIDRLNSLTFTIKDDSVADIVEQQEFRIMKFLSKDVSKASQERFLHLNDDCIEEIVVHQNISENAKNEITLFANELGIKVKTNE